MNERAERVAEVLGYRREWPDGHSSFKVWSKDGRHQPLGWRPSDEQLILWLLDAAGLDAELRSRSRAPAGGPLVSVVSLTGARQLSVEGAGVRDALENLVLAVADA